jgi:HPt (histidine-containing phosphotransfer) domain-containing protein
MHDRSTELPLLDMDTWQAFLSMWDDEPSGFVEALLDEFLRDAARHMAAIQSALTHADPDLLEQAAHTLGSSSANLGAERLVALCRQCERMAHNPDLDEIAERLPLLLATLQETRRLLRDELGRHSAT